MGDSQAPSLVEAAEAHQRGELARALALYRAVLARAPPTASAHHLFGVALHQSGQPSEGAAAIRRSLALDPDNAEAWTNLGLACAEAGARAEAEEAWRRALAADPERVAALNNLGQHLAEDGRYEAARRLLGRALERDPDYVPARTNLGRALSGLKRYREAGEHLSYACRLAPSDPAPLVNLGVALKSDEQVERAEACFRRATELDPGLAEAWSNWASALKDLGRMADAEAAYRRAIACNPSHTRAWTGLTALKRFTPEDPDWTALRGLEAGEAALSPTDGIDLAFALGKAQDDIGDIEQAFAYYRKANDAKRRTFDYRIEDEDAFARAVETRLTEACVSRLAGSGPSTPRPVFVVGMPRSGTTLVEQILGRHPALQPVGEPFWLARVWRRLFPRGLDGPAERWLTPDRCRMAGALYQTLSAERAQPGAPVVYNKPLDFKYLGLIPMMLPSAVIVYCRRDPMAVGLSCYRQHFADGLAFTYDLYELGRFHRFHERMMAHWAPALGSALITVDYEDLVSDPAPVIEKLLNHCRRPWADACLSPQLGEGAVSTASAWQVRQPIHAASVDHWRRYAPYLSALRQGLEEGS